MNWFSNSGKYETSGFTKEKYPAGTCIVEKPTNSITDDKVCSKCVIVDGSIVNGRRDCIFFTSVPHRV